MENKKVAAVVPAFDEETTVGNVLKILLSSELLEEVILVDDGSTDRTAEIAENIGAKVVRLKKNSGKAKAMREGAKFTEADIIVFFDADLISLKQHHIVSLLKPVMEGKAVMCVGVRGRWGGLPKIFSKFFPVFFAIAGERAIKRQVFLDIPEKFIFNMTDGVVMNYYCKVNNLPVKFRFLDGLDIIVKESKRGLARGLIERIKMIMEFIKVRIIISLNKKAFLKSGDI